MVVGANLKVHTEYISVLVPPPSKEHEQLESGYNSSTSASCSEILPKIKRPITAQQDKHGEKKSIFPVNSDHSTIVQHNLQQRQTKHALQQINHTPITTYRRLKTANSLISVDMMVTKEFKSNQTNISSDRSPCLLTLSKYQKEIANYSDDWESDYSDDCISDCADNWRPASKETPKPTKIPMQKESISDLKTDSKEATKPTNVSTQKESTSDLKTDLKEPLTFINVREQPQFETDSSNNNIRLVPSDLNAFEPAFCQQRQAAINNMAYRTAVHSWKARIQFGLQVPDGFNGRKTFPTTYSTFSKHKCQIMGPFDGSLKAGSKVTIQCRIPGAYCARLLLDENWLSEDILKNDMFKREFTVPKREIVIYVQFSDKKNRSSYDGLYKYSVH
ncbi:unnamed protein product [Rotaria sordida]|uniref:Uncharacterized protein n=1 Tax=Rotaria sordida TaxID=392033 RepID=A0A813Y4Y2_9BILA|nr:unnamed protein product [Rotaria sordida]CAF0997795.1 unnamed protein product [Rotaria sordida]